MNKIVLEKVKCDYCGSLKQTKLFFAKDYYNDLPGIFNVVRCDNCGLIFTSPRPSKKSMNYYYPKKSGYYHFYKPQAKQLIKKYLFGLILDWYFGYKKLNITNRFLRVVSYPLLFIPYFLIKAYGVPDFVNHGTLLDVGCSYGYFLYEMKALGWHVQGVEMDRDCCRIGREKLGIRITNSDFESYRTRKKFDVVVLRMFLEHTFSVRQTLVKAKNLLKTNGQLIIIVPDFDGYESRIYRNYAYTLQLPTHLFHFTPQLIRKYLSDYSFYRIIIYHQSVDRDMIAPTGYRARSGVKITLIEKMIRIPFIRSTLLALLIFLMAFFGKTSRMTIYCRKT